MFSDLCKLSHAYYLKYKTDLITVDYLFDICLYLLCRFCFENFYLCASGILAYTLRNFSFWFGLGWAGLGLVISFLILIFIPLPLTQSVSDFDITIIVS